MDERIKAEALEALREGFDGVLGLKEINGVVRPYLFRNAEELDELVTEWKRDKGVPPLFSLIQGQPPKYNLSKTLRLMLKKRPDLRLAAILRGCDVRALRALEKKGEINLDRLRVINIVCSMEQAEACNCAKPVYNTFQCTGCWSCVEACPENAISRINICPLLIPSEYDEGLSYRKAIYIKYPQAVPLKAVRDDSRCLKLTGRQECKGCEYICQAQAVVHDDREQKETLEVGAIVLAPGFRTFQPQGLEEYVYSGHPNVVTSIEFERLLSASGPTRGHLIRPSDHREPKKIAWFQCVGSRDINHCDNGYCSAVCCMYAIKQAVIAKEHAGRDLDTAIFFMDMRTHGKDFERYYNRARQEHGVRFIRSRVHSVNVLPGTGDLELAYVTDDGSVVQETFDMVVLSVGLEITEEMREFAEKLGVELNENGFCRTSVFEPVATSRPGIYVCGVFQGPKDIPQSVMEASAAAADVGRLLSPARGSLIREVEVPPQRDVRNEPPRIGVFVCHCGINIAGTVDVQAVRDYAKTLPYVEYVADNLYTCSQDTQALMREAIKEHNLNRVVVAACTPRTHEPLFQETLESAGLNKYLFEMANIRNQDSWIHDDREAATEKAKDLVRMAVAKAALLEPLDEPVLEVNQEALVVGGGVSGMVAARSLADQGYRVHLVDKSDRLGGTARGLYRTWTGEDVSGYLQELISSVENNPLIKLYLRSEIVDVDGFVGNFRTKIRSRKGNGSGSEEVIEISHGVAIIAVGAHELKPEEYRYGDDPRIVTHLELDELFRVEDPKLAEVGTAVFIQCVGSREPNRPYCSRVCCTHTLESALELKRRNPDCNVFVLYRDMRSYGERESLYLKAREAGVIFVRFDLDNKPVVMLDNGRIIVEVVDHVLRKPIRLEADLVALAAAIVPGDYNKIAQYFKVPLNEDGFFVEAHAKLRPVDFATDGVFVCGLAHYPKSIDESIAQAKAAAARAVTVLAKGTLRFPGTVARTDQMLCSSCGTCVSICPYSAPRFNDKGKAEINPALCKGCGLCVASCRSGAIHLMGFDDAHIFSMIECA
ncbi:FAD-dependent oxidoreductase [Thermodesulforhabdus norvegica]|uniref:Heterodisulfide reductase subunit A n=1 Tax=Thermodesulforhabdus norvegica TaxID=39841 RepID=A0A1I4QVP4_9BACT|nr:FAD-dependent oxidoreductase [Thermodesulforhabdus norvegica]SFM44081.1 heterodisulfide reductase subunit A [Thermodesulforhabdus norvegica]